MMRCAGAGNRHVARTRLGKRQGQAGTYHEYGKENAKQNALRQKNASDRLDVDWVKEDSGATANGSCHQWTLRRIFSSSQAVTLTPI